MLQYAMLSLLVALIAGFVGFAGLAGPATGLTKGLFVICLVAFVFCMVSQTSRRV